MSLYTRRGRVDISTSDSEINSVASSGDQSPDEMIEELARMALAGRYSGSPKTYETNEMLRGHGMARRPRPSEDAAPSTAPPSAGPSPPLTPRRAGVAGGQRPASSSPPSRGARQRAALAVPSRMREADDADCAADVSRALQRMYRHLAREYATEIQQEAAKQAEKSAKDGGRSASGGGDDAPKKPKKKEPHVMDEAALARLLTRNKVQELRQAEKYHKVKEREEEARKHPKRVRVPEKAVILGRRLHLEAAENRRIVKEKQEEAAQQRAAEVKAACTFHPTISRYAERLAAREGHYTLEERLEDQPLRDEEMQRLRFARAVEQEKACTFQPTLSVGTQELIAQQRRRRSTSSSSTRRRKGSRTRSRTGSGHRRRTAHEPFEPGERLYRDGAERLLRQQIRQQRALARQQRHVVGSRLRLSAEEAGEVVSRFTAWASARAERQAAQPEEAEREVRTGNPSNPAALHRSVSSRTASTARPKSSPLPSRLDENLDADAGDERGGMPAQTPTLHSDAFSLSASRRPTTTTANINNGHPANPTWPATDAVVSLRTTSGASGSTFSHGRAAPTAEEEDAVRDDRGGQCGTSSMWGDAAADAAGRKEQLRIRLGALFYKYVVSPTATTVSPHEVRQQVRLYYPEDSGVADALTSAFDNADQRLSKVDFMAALARYVAQNGPQPWCMPQSARERATQYTSAPSAGSSGSVPVTFLQRLDAPTSSAASSRGKGLDVDHQAESQPPRSASARSETTATINNAGLASPYRTPVGSAQQANRPSRSASVSEAGMRASTSSLAAPSSSKGSGALGDEAKPIRMHIYTRTGDRAAPSPPALPAAAADKMSAWPDNGGSGGRRRGEASGDGDVTSSASAQRPFVTSVEEEDRERQTQQSHPQAQPRRQASRAASLQPVPSAHLVHGYESHVERHRRTAHLSKTQQGASKTVDREGRVAAAECTFTPTLNRHSVALSDVNLERRTLYARELQLRRHELQMLRAAVLRDATATPTSATVSPTSSRGDGGACAGAKKDAPTDSPAALRTPPSRRREARTRSPGSASPAGTGQSPSIDLSSLSSATAQLERSGGTAVPKSPPPQETAPPGEAGRWTEAGMAPPALPPSAASHFFAQRPTHAVL